MLLRTWAIVRKEFIQILRDTRALAVIILLPILMLVLYGYAINMDVKHLPTVVHDQDKTSAARDLVRAFENSEYYDVLRYVDSPADVDRAIGHGEAKLVLVIPRGYARDLADGRRAQVQVIVDGSDSTTASIGISYAQATIDGYSSRITVAAAARAGMTRSDVLQPLDYRPRVWYNPELKSSNFTVPGLIAVILMMLSALLTSMTVVRERERGTIEQLVVSPIMPHELMIGKMVPYVVISFLDVVLVTVLGRILFDVPLRGSIPLLMLLSTVFLVAALGIGLLISSVSTSQQGAMTIAMMATMLPATILSGFMFPIASMPLAVQAATYLIPARYFVVILRGVFLKGVGLTVLWPQAGLLVLFGLVTVTLSTLKYKKQL